MLADKVRLQADLARRRSSAGDKHVNRKRALKRPGKGNRNQWKKESR